MNEKQAKSKLVSELRALGFWCYSHEDRYTPGVPDVSASGPPGRKRTIWLEVKVLEPGDVDWVSGSRLSPDAQGDQLWGGVNYSEHFGSHSKGHFRQQQLMNLIALKTRANLAEYAILIDRARRSPLVIAADPDEVLLSLKDKRRSWCPAWDLQGWAERMAK